MGADLNAKINEVKHKIPNITNLTTNTAVGSKITVVNMWLLQNLIN